MVSVHLYSLAMPTDVQFIGSFCHTSVPCGDIDFCHKVTKLILPSHTDLVGK